MKPLSETIQAKLDARASTFCNCWRISRADGVIMGFTDHDRDIRFASVLYKASTGVASSEIENTLGFSVATNDIIGALRDDGVTESDLALGVYDAAAVETWLVDWNAPEDRALLDVAMIGEVKRGEFAFSAELRSKAHIFDQQRGQAYQQSCCADLGDTKCKVNLDDTAFSATGTIMRADGRHIVVDLPVAFAPGFFSGGALTFSSGARAGSRLTIRSHLQDGLQASLTFWNAPPDATAAGDLVLLAAGCDKSVATCQAKFQNVENFRGFPHIPGNDRVIGYPGSLAPVMDGGSFFR